MSPTQPTLLCQKKVPRSYVSPNFFYILQILKNIMSLTEKHYALTMSQGKFKRDPCKLMCNRNYVAGVLAKWMDLELESMWVEHSQI